MRNTLSFVVCDVWRKSLGTWYRNLFFGEVFSLPYTLLLAFCSSQEEKVKVLVGKEISTLLADADSGRVFSKSRFSAKEGRGRRRGTYTDVQSKCWLRAK